MIPLCEQTRKLFAPVTDAWEGFHTDDRLTIGLTEEGDFILDPHSFQIDRTGQTFRGSCHRCMRLAIARIPEQKPLVGGANLGFYRPIHAGASDTTVELIAALIPIQHIHFVDENASNLFYYILQCSQLADKNAQLVSEFKNNKVVPEHNYELNADKPLLPYQQVALCLQQRSIGFGLFMEQGTGKTPISIAAICNAAIAHREAGNTTPYKVIIVCPNTLRTNWLNEFYQFATRGGRVTILKGTQVNRVKLLCDAFAPAEDGEELYFTVVICGYQMLWRTWESLQLLRWDLAIIDEAQAITNVSAIQSKHVLQLRDNATQRVALTGTPMEQSILHVYNILEFLERGGSGFTSHKAWRDFYGVWDRGEQGHEILVGCQNLPFLQERLARCSFFISKKEALPDLPDKVYDILEVEMPDNQQKAYNKLQTQLAIEIDAQLANSTLQRSMVVNNILTQLLRLSQITSGFMSWAEVCDLDGEVVQPKFYEYFDPNPKIEAVLGLLAEKDATEKTIIWANWLPDVEYLAAACEQHNIGHCVFRGLHSGYTDEDRKESVRRFNEDRDCKVFIGTAGSGGAGLNLLGYPPNAAEGYDTDCTHVIYFSQDWSSIKRAQSEDRAHRRGTRRSVRYTTIVVPDSIDVQIHEKVTDKRRTALGASDLTKILAEAINYKKAVT